MKVFMAIDSSNWAAEAFDCEYFIQFNIELIVKK